MISFKFNATKFASAVAYFAKRKQLITKKEICKLMFFADQTHLLLYGRTITGDKYNALPQGPIPSMGLDMLNQKHSAPIEYLEIMKRFGSLNGNAFVPLCDPDRTVFSRSDLKVLEATMDSFGHLSAKELEDLSHKEQAWVKAEIPNRMDFDLFFEGHPEAQEMRNIVNIAFSEAVS